MKNTTVLFLSGLIGLGNATSAAAADPVIRWSWSFDQTRYTVRYDESIVVRATLRNDAISTGTLHVDGAGFNFGGDLQKLYDFRFGSPESPHGEEFVNLNLAPGESHSFVFGTLTPIGGAVPLGTWRSDAASMGIAGFERPAGNSFQIEVVPEPSMVTLGLLGAGLVFGRRNRTRPVR